MYTTVLVTGKLQVKAESYRSAISQGGLLMTGMWRFTSSFPGQRQQRERGGVRDAATQRAGLLGRSAGPFGVQGRS